MNNLFYFPIEGTLCWIAGYRSSPRDFVAEDRKAFCTETGADSSLVLHYIVNESPRYKHNHVFHTLFNADSVPKGTMIIESYTIFEWLHKV